MFGSSRGSSLRRARGSRWFASRALVATAFVCIAAASAPDPTLGQEASRGEQRSPLVAALLQGALPPLPLGYIYADDLRRAIIPTSLMVGGSVAFILGTVELVDWTDEERSPALFYGGLGAILVGYVYGIVDAADAVRDRNARLRGVTSVQLGPSHGGIGIRVSLKPR